MLGLAFPARDEPFRLLCLGAHADDIEIGCGGTLLTLLGQRDDITVTWVVLAADGDRAGEAESSAISFLEGARESRVIVKPFRDGFLPYLGPAVKECFEQLKGEVDPDLVLTHYEGDRHQDHRLVAELTWNTFRRHLIFEYEIPKYDGDLANPGAFVPLTEQTARRKVELLQAHFTSQGTKHWFDEELFFGLLRLRGMQANEPTRYAEAFHCRKLTLAF